MGVKFTLGLILTFELRVIVNANLNKIQVMPRKKNSIDSVEVNFKNFVIVIFIFNCCFDFYKS